MWGVYKNACKYPCSRKCVHMELLLQHGSKHQTELSADFALPSLIPFSHLTSLQNDLLENSPARQAESPWLQANQWHGCTQGTPTRWETRALNFSQITSNIQNVPVFFPKPCPDWNLALAKTSTDFRLQSENSQHNLEQFIFMLWLQSVITGTHIYYWLSR